MVLLNKDCQLMETLSESIKNLARYQELGYFLSNRGWICQNDTTPTDVIIANVSDFCNYVGWDMICIDNDYLEVHGDEIITITI